MREKIKDSGRLKHILDAINTLMEQKERYTFDEVVADPIIFYGFVKHVEIKFNSLNNLKVHFLMLSH